MSTVTISISPAGIGPGPAAGDYGWQDRALCAQTDPEAFFPEKGSSTRAAKRVCRACEVRPECLAYALRRRERFGVFGGVSERERIRLERQFGGDIPAAVAFALAADGQPGPGEAAA